MAAAGQLESQMSTAGDTPTGWDLLRAHRAPVMAAAALAAIYAWLFWDFLGTQVRWALRHQADWGHTLVIPLIAGWFIWHRRVELTRLMPFRTTWSGLLPVVVGVGWYTICSLVPAVRNHDLQALGVWLVLVGCVVLFFGYRPMRYLWFPLVFLFIFGQSASDRAMTPITFRFSKPIRAETLNGSYAVIDLKTGTTTTLTSDRVNSSTAAWSPDGNWLYFLSDRSLVSVVPSPWGPRQPEPYFDKPQKMYRLALKTGIRSPFQPRECRPNGSATCP